MWERCISANYLFANAEDGPESWYCEKDEILLPEAVTSLKHDILENIIDAELLQEQLLDSLESVTVELISFVKNRKDLELTLDGGITIRPRKFVHNGIIQQIVAMSGYFYTTYTCGFCTDFFDTKIHYAFDSED